MKHLVVDNDVHRAIIAAKESLGHRNWLHENWPMRKPSVGTVVAQAMSTLGAEVDLSLEANRTGGQRWSFDVDRLMAGESRLVRLIGPGGVGPKLAETIERWNRRDYRPYDVRMDPQCNPSEHPITGERGYWITYWRAELPEDKYEFEV